MKVEIHLDGENDEDGAFPWTALEARDALREFMADVRIPSEDEHINSYVLAAMDEIVLKLTAKFEEHGIEFWLRG